MATLSVWKDWGREGSDDSALVLADKFLVIMDFRFEYEIKQSHSL